MTKQVLVPDIGDFQKVEIIEEEVIIVPVVLIIVKLYMALRLIA